MHVLAGVGLGVGSCSDKRRCERLVAIGDIDPSVVVFEAEDQVAQQCIVDAGAHGPSIVPAARTEVPACSLGGAYVFV